MHPACAFRDSPPDPSEPKKFTIMIRGNLRLKTGGKITYIKLNYIVGMLKNWENESILTVGEVDSYQENQKPITQHRQSTQLFPGGREYSKWL